MVIVVMGALRRISRNLQIIGTKSVSLTIGIGEDPSLKQFIIGIVYTRYNNGRAKCKLFVLGKEVIYVLIQDHAANGLEGQNILRPDLSYVKWVKVKSVFIFRIQCLDIKFPLRIVSSSNWIVKVLGGMTMVGSSNPDGLVVQETLFTTGGFPMKFDIVRPASFADEGVCVDTKTIHVPVILGDTYVVE